MTAMKLQLLLLAALVGSVVASKGHHVHHISSTSDFEEKTGDGKVRGPDHARMELAELASPPAFWALPRLGGSHGAA